MSRKTTNLRKQVRRQNQTAAKQQSTILALQRAVVDLKVQLVQAQESANCNGTVVRASRDDRSRLWAFTVSISEREIHNTLAYPSGGFQELGYMLHQLQHDICVAVEKLFVKTIKGEQQNAKTSLPAAVGSGPNWGLHTSQGR